jgi:O-antigen/teichoic acid export membrane protein
LKIWRAGSVYIYTYSSIIITFIVNVLLIRMLNISEYGAYSFMLAIVGVIEGAVVARSGELYLRTVSENWHNKQKDSTISDAKYLIRQEMRLYIIVFALLVFLANMLEKMQVISNSILLIVVALSIPLQLGKGIYKSHLTLTNKVKYQSYIEVRQSIFYALASIAATYFYGLNGLICSIPIITLFRTLSFRAIYLKEIGLNLKTWREHSTSMKVTNQWGTSTASIIRNIQLNGVSQIDILIIGIMSTPDTVALLKASKLLSGLPVKASIPIWKQEYPKIIESVISSDKKGLNRSILRGYFMSAAILLSILLVFQLFGKEIIQLLYKEEYANSFEVVFYLLLGYGAYFSANGWLKSWAVIAKSQLYGIYYYTGGLAITVICSLIYFNEPAEYAKYTSYGLTILSTSVFCFFIYMHSDKKSTKT